jgi:hypothetical protein
LNDARGIFSFGSSSSFSPLTHSTNIPSPPPSPPFRKKENQHGTNGNYERRQGV